jgi:MYXO-CTERM domain-containing protein
MQIRSRNSSLLWITLASAAIGCNNDSSDSIGTTTTVQATTVNAGFETGDLTGWTPTTGLNRSHVDPVTSFADLAIAAGGNAATQVLSGALNSQVPPGLIAADSLKYPRYGTKATVVNNWDPRLGNVNILRQTATTVNADVDPRDGKVHVRMVLAPFSRDGGHPATQQPYYFVGFRNVTKNADLTFRYAFANQPGVPWKISTAPTPVAAEPWLYTDWQLVDQAFDSSQIAIGDQIEITIVSSRCSPSGHEGKLLIDEVGNFIPGVIVAATAAPTIGQTQNVTITHAVTNDSSAAETNVQVRMTIPVGSTYVSVSAPGATCTEPAVGSTGTDVVCTYPSLAVRAQSKIDLVVKATGAIDSFINHGNYDVRSDQETLLLGPLTQTKIIAFVDTDGDGLGDSDEVALGTNPNDPDTDDDGVVDGVEPSPSVDSDGDGLINALDVDSDNDGLFDGTELGVAVAGTGTDTTKGFFIPDADPATKTNPLLKDTDGGGVSDGNEDVNRNGRKDSTETNPVAGNGADDGALTDTDGDGLSDGLERSIGSNPNDNDTDDDGVVDGQEPNFASDTDGDGLINVLDADSDNDGLYDGTESGVTTPAAGTNIGAGVFTPDADNTTKTNPLFRDTDKGGARDGAEDTNKNGKIDAGERNPNLGSDDVPAPLDSDGDGLTNAEETAAGSNPNDNDTDDDGVVDGLEPNWRQDSDGDGLINVLDPDSDNDVLFDGTESGVTTGATGTDASKGVFVPDADPATRTSPLVKDTDRGSVSDGNEDVNRNGRRDGAETNPTAGNGADDVLVDSDGDGLSNAFETAIGSNPNDNDTDDDGVVDGAEPNLTADTDGDGLINVLDSDADNDGLFDGTESGVTTPATGTNVGNGQFIPDADPSTLTSPLVRDTDGGGKSDGAEDANRNGKQDVGETNPTLGNGADDNTVVDTDGDGLSDLQEAIIGTNPNDKDSDDDGVLDGAEPNPSADSDGDGLVNGLDPDSDNDGLFDGTELGVTTPNADTNVNKGVFIADANPATRTNPLDADTDNGGVKDGSEDINRNGRVDAGETNPTAGNGADDRTVIDTDRDGISNAAETAAGTNPTDADTDDDGIIDGDEPNWNVDSDGDGLINALDPDSDNDGLFDGTEVGITTPNAATDVGAGHFIADADPSTTTKPLDPDTDRGGVKDGTEDNNHDGNVDAGELNPLNPADDSTLVDADGDGVSDAEETAIGSNPNDPDTDDDGTVDGREPNRADDTDGDGLINILDPDSDNDGLFDGTEMGVTTPSSGTDVTKGVFIADADPTTTSGPLNRDTDKGGVGDGSEDANRNGRVDAGERNPNLRSDDAGIVDSDGDGLSNAAESALGSNPNDKDTDDDGVLDGAEPNLAADTDGDGLINVLDPDSDNDGLFDGTELGVTTPNADTNVARGNFIPDADPATKTSPLLADTDKGGVKDGSEDPNRNGKIDAGELDPNNPADDATAVDTDGDGLSDAAENALGSNPNDNDTDDDGVVDGAEPNLASDTDGDGLINVLDPDSDNDGLFDGTELGVTTPATGTDLTRDSFIADADPATRTSPLLRDSDGGGVRDGSEDGNHNGRVDAGEINPVVGNAADDASVLDADGDGLSDAEEAFLGSNPNDNDSDDDGVIDGNEPNYSADSDGDGVINVLDPDSDNDGLFDGTELGITVRASGTAIARGNFIPDADPATRTNPLLRDTDKGGVIDGSEDSNRNGKVDAGDLNPLNPADDATRVDTDDDGLTDATEESIGTDPNDPDSDDDGVLDGLERNPTADTDGDGLINALDADSDDDGLFDGTELGIVNPGPGTDVTKGNFIPDADPATTTNMLNPDTDGGGVKDGSEDANHNGKVDTGEINPTIGNGADDAAVVDTDGDGLSDAEEAFLGSNPMDKDTDDDGALDGEESNPGNDTDGDGLINILDPDSDNDGLFDGTEKGVTTPNADTDVTQGNFIADADPDSTTGSLSPDTDRGGKRDGAEDSNHNGKVDDGEQNPTLGNGADDISVVDTDGDGLSDKEEQLLGSNPMDKDSDDDGVLDGAEANYAADSDGDGLPNVIDPDSDDDGLWDGTEVGVTTPDADTNVANGHFIPDADPATRTSMVNPDTDGGGVADGAEDANHNGKVDAGEINPTVGNAADDSQVKDSDGDGLSDAEEVFIGTNPNDADTDDDGLPDGQEPNVADDTDGDGIINGLDVDSDNDGIFDGTEAGIVTPGAGTDTTKGTFIPDADPTTTTSPVDPDSDDGGVRDGSEDANHNGKVDTGETDPNDPADDIDVVDTDLDGVSDAEEATLGSNPNDRDSDDDGVIDGKEINPSQDYDNDGKNSVLDEDSDNDKLFDGTEEGVTAPDRDTDVTKGHYRADADPLTQTNPLDEDSDNGGVKDGDEDRNQDGKVDAGETDPGRQRDDDRDFDGIPDVGDGSKADNCVDVVNADQADLDVDGIGDACDPDADGDGFVDGYGVSGGSCSTSGSSGGGMMLMAAVLGMIAMRRRRRGLQVATTTAAICSAIGAAHAQSLPEPQDFSVERFTLSSDRGGILNVESGNIPTPWSWDAHLWLGFANDPLVIYQNVNGSRNRVGSLVENRLGGELGGSLVVTDRLAIAADLAVVFSQSRPSTQTGVVSTLGDIGGVGLGDLRIAPKLSIWQQEKNAKGMGLSLVAELTVPTSGNDNYRGDKGVTVFPYLAFSSGARLHWGVNLGYLARTPKKVGDLRVDDELRFRAGLGYSITDAIDLGVTGSVTTAANEIFGNFARNASEVIAGPQFSFGDNWVAFAAGGIGLQAGYGTPDYRALAGLRIGKFGGDSAMVVDEGRPALPLDTDKDGVVDSVDKCINEPENINAFQDEDGCPDVAPAATVAPPADKDGDGIIDADDKCPSEAEDKDAFEDTDGCPDPDNDKDGVLDGSDKCINEPGTADNAGCPDKDRDGDGVIDRLDNCPDEPGEAKFNGCKKKQLATITASGIQIVDVVYFKTNKDIILGKSYPLLDNVAQVIKAHSEIPLITIEGHTDDRGNDAYNLDLSQRRAEAVKVYLVSKGVDATRLAAKGFGETQPIADNKTNKGRSTNRRVEFKIAGIESQRTGPNDSLDKTK